MSETSDFITITVRRSHLYVGLGLVLAFVAGFGTATVVNRPLAAGEPTPGAVAAPAAQPASGDRVEVDIAGRPFRGSARAPVTIVEFTDYQCPFCARHFRETLPPLLDRYGDDVKYVVRNFPVSTLHPRAQAAAEAAECAADQDRFWEYHDLLLSNPTQLDDEALHRYGAQAGLDGDRFRRCLEDHDKAALVARDLEDGRRYGVRGTPTFFINGRILVGAEPLATFETRIREELDRD